MTQTQTYLKTFFDEKDIPYKQFEIEHDGIKHFIDNEVVIEHILAAPTSEQEQIAPILRKLDFLNGDINHFLEHLAHGLVANNF